MLTGFTQNSKYKILTISVLWGQKCSEWTDSWQNWANTRFSQMLGELVDKELKAWIWHLVWEGMRKSQMHYKLSNTPGSIYKYFLQKCSKIRAILYLNLIKITLKTFNHWYIKNSCILRTAVYTLAENVKMVNCDVYSLVQVCYFFNEAANYYPEFPMANKCVWRVEGHKFFKLFLCFFCCFRVILAVL